MKRILLPSIVLCLLVTASCKKCQTCTTNTTQNVWGYDQTTSTTEEYCGDSYDDAPEEGTYNQSTNGVDQSVVITCKEG